ncbi:MAG: hypothetical protein OXT63_01990 [Gemmatimonadota bacterium]|nr:hypothetical protein [Gemmatimonadota bacterium]
MNTNSSCPIWETPASVHYLGEVDAMTVDSSRTAGCYYITGTAATVVSHCEPDVKARLTTWLIEQRQLGVERPEILSETIEGLPRHALPVHVRADRLLQYIQRSIQHVASIFELRFNDGAAQDCLEIQAWSESTTMDEVIYLLSYLEEQNWLREHAHSMGVLAYIVTVRGHARLAELATAMRDSSQAFVAMWFDKEMASVRNLGIVPGIEGAGYDAMVIDQKEHVNKIDDEIIGEIRRSRFIVADFTHGEAGARGSVYYEAGFAEGLGIPVIATCRADMVDKIHFDRRQYNHLLWEEDALDDLRLRLQRRIVAIMSDGPRR